MLQINNLTKLYNKDQINEYKALCSISLSIADGEMIAVIGKSGAGKSTLLHVLACIDTYDSGEYYIDNKLIKSLKECELAKIRNHKIGMVMQDFALINEFTCLENVMLPLDFSGIKKNNSKKLALEAMKEVGIEHLYNHKAGKLSGGQKQRVAIARAIVNDPMVILADEPTGALDSKTASDIMLLFKKLNKAGRTIVIVTHDNEIASQCNRIIEIADGKVV